MGREEGGSLNEQRSVWIGKGRGCSAMAIPFGGGFGRNEISETTGSSIVLLVFNCPIIHHMNYIRLCAVLVV